MEGLIFEILWYYKFDLHLSIPIYISVYVTHCFPHISPSFRITVSERKAVSVSTPADITIL